MSDLGAILIFCVLLALAAVSWFELIQWLEMLL
jgi:hypothetical protein